MNKSIMKKAFGRGLRESGFERKGESNWYLHSDELIIVVNLQKSSWSQLWYVNLGIWILALGSVEWPQIHVCHVQSRAARLWPKRRFEFEKLFDFDEERFPDDQWSRKIEIFAHDFLVPMCRTLLSKEKLTEEIRKRSPGEWRVATAAYSWLGLPKNDTPSKEEMVK